jgi:hypothetical protein
MASSSDLPPWLRGGDRRAGGGAGRGRPGRTAAATAFALVLFGGGAFTGYLVAGRHLPAETAAAPPPVCPPAPICAPTPAAHGPAAHASAGPSARHPKLVPAALKPLPERAQLDDGERTQALRAFAEKKAAELRDCLLEPDRGPPLKLGAAFEIGANGAVDFVQILGADGSSKEVKRCYATRLKRWRFPEELLRGEEKLLVNFVL